MYIAYKPRDRKFNVLGYVSDEITLFDDLRQNYACGGLLVFSPNPTCLYTCSVHPKVWGNFPSSKKWVTRSYDKRTSINRDHIS